MGHTSATLVMLAIASRDLDCISSLHKFQSNLNTPLTVCLTIADPHFAKILPIAAAALYREPRSCHEVDTLQSQTSPKVIKSYTLDRTASD